MSLTNMQKEYVDMMLDEKLVLLDDRDHNRNEVDRLKRLASTEPNVENYKILKSEIIKGENYIEAQSAKIKLRSNKEISRHLNVCHIAVKNYALSSTKPKILVGFEKKKKAYEMRKALGQVI